MSSRDLIAPIGYYDRLVWLGAFLILGFTFTTLGVVIFTEAYWPILFLFIMAGFFFPIWWVGVEEPERPPLEFLVARIGLGFMLGLGGLWFLFYFFTSLQFLQTYFLHAIWTPGPFAALGFTGSVLLQLGVGAVEEGIFRVALPRLLLARRINAASVIFLSNWIFGLFHWRAYQGDIKALLVAVFVGILQSFAYFASRSAIGVMLGHAIWNLHAVGLLGGFFLVVAWGLLLIGLVYYLKLRKWRVPLLS